MKGWRPERGLPTVARSRAMRAKVGGPDRDRACWLTRTVSRLPEHGRVQRIRPKGGLVDLTGIEPVTS